MSSLASKLSTTSFALARNASTKGHMVKQVIRNAFKWMIMIERFLKLILN